MKILHVIGAFDKKLGGTYSAILSIMKMEQLLGYTNEVMSLRTLEQEYDADFEDRIHLFEPSFPFKFSTSAKASAWLKDHIKDYDLLLIHEVWGATAISAARTAHKNSVPYVIWPHGSLDPFDLQKKQWLKNQVGRALISGIARRAAAICCTSDLESDVLNTFNEYNTNVSILPLPINYQVKGSREIFRAFYEIPADDLVFLFLSRVDYKKGLDLFLYAYRKFLNTTAATNTRFLIAGKGKPAYEQKIKLLIDELKLNDQVKVSGFLTGSLKADAYKGSDCFVLTSMNENYGISVIEALQSGLPVLISDNVYIHQDIMPEGGWLCEYEVSSIYNQLITLYTEFQDKSIAKKDPVATGNKFNQESLMPRYAAFYNKLARKHTRLENTFKTAVV